MTTLSRICRHPIKSLGEETIERTQLTPGDPIPHDRTWVVVHGRSDYDPEAGRWTRSRNFVIQNMHPKLAQMTAKQEGDFVTLTHPDLGAISVNPDMDGEALCTWVAPVLDSGAAPAPYYVARPPRPMTDFVTSHISIGSLASLRALEGMADAKMSGRRFRMNLWLDDLEPWTEQDWIGKEISVGPTRLRVIDPCKRCNATNANPMTGVRDMDVLRLLHTSFRHMYFGVYAQVIEGGEVSAGDKVSVL